MQDQLAELLSARKGHFRFESGHHGDLWLDLELLCLQPRRVEPFAAELARRVADWQPEAICGPLNEGAFVGMMVAANLERDFTYSERFENAQSEELFPVAYRVPSPLAAVLRGKRVVIVNDVINAGSAVRATFADLCRLGARPVGVAALATLGSTAAVWAAENDLPLVSLSQFESNLWLPESCPLCEEQVRLE